MKAKIIISAMFLFLFSYSSFAQEVNEYKWGCSFAINSIQGQMGFPGLTPLDLDENGNLQSGGNKTSKSLSLSIIPKYFISNDFMLRLEICKTTINQEQNSDYYYQSVHYAVNETVQENILRLCPALQLNYVRKKFFEAYSGMSLIYVSYGKYLLNSYAETRDSATNVLTVWGKNDISIDGGYAAGIGALTGFNFYLQKHISLGAEFSSSFLYYKLGGEYIINTSNQVIPNPTVTTSDNQPLRYKGFRFSNILSSFNISIWF